MGDYSKAQVLHFLHDVTQGMKGTVLESTKAPPAGSGIVIKTKRSPNCITPGMLANPVQIGSVLEDGTTQLYQYTYNAQGFPTQSIDPLGRTINYTYAANGIDLLTVQQVNGATSDLLATYTWDTKHNPLTFTDAAGAATTYTYNPQGQLTSVVDPQNNKATFTYDASGYLTAMDGPLPGTIDQVTSTFDTYGQCRLLRPAKATPVGLTYDALDRLTSVIAILTAPLRRLLTSCWIRPGS